MKTSAELRHRGTADPSASKTDEKQPTPEQPRQRPPARPIKVEKPRTQRSTCFAYLLHLVLGLFGVHHVYLNRPIQAFIWLTTFGGFGVGWLRDLYMIPSYVRQANADPKFVEEMTKRVHSGQRPVVTNGRSLGQILVGLWYGWILSYTVDHAEAPEWQITTLRCIGISVGMYLTAISGGCRSTRFLPILASHLFCQHVAVMYMPEHAHMIGFWVANYACGRFLVHAPPKTPPQTRCQGYKRNAKVLAAAVVFLAVVSVACYHNLEFSVEDGESLKLKEHIENLKDSSAYHHISMFFRVVWKDIQDRGIWPILQEMWESTRNSEDDSALQTLGLGNDASWSDIKRAFRKLSLKYHPDKNPSPQAKRKYLKITKAYELLSKVYK